MPDHISVITQTRYCAHLHYHQGDPFTSKFYATNQMMSPNPEGVGAIINVIQYVWFADLGGRTF